MRIFVLSTILAFLGVASGPLFASSNCEVRLTTAIGKVTKDALATGQVSLQEIKDLVDSETPLNPLRFRTPDSSNIALFRFYAAVIAKYQNPSSWAEARAELRGLIAGTVGDANAAAEAKAGTAEILLPLIKNKFPLAADHGKMQIVSDAETGISYVLSEERSDASPYTVREMITGKETRIEIGTEFESSYAAIGRDEPGRAIFTVVAKMNTGFWKGLFGNAWNYKISKIDLTTGTRTDHDVSLRPKGGFGSLFAANGAGTDVLEQGGSLTALSAPFADFDPATKGLKFLSAVRGYQGTPVFAFRYNDNTIRLYTVRNGQWTQMNSKGIVCNQIGSVKVYALRDGRFTVICRDENFDDMIVYHPFVAEPGASTVIPNQDIDIFQQGKTVELEDGRFFLVVQNKRGSANNFNLDVYEPFVSNASLRTLPGINDFVPFEHNKSLFVIAVAGYPSVGKLFEPLISDVAVGSCPLRGRLVSITPGANGQKDLVAEVVTGEMSVISLFHKP